MSRRKIMPPILLVAAGVALMAVAGQLAYSAPGLVGLIVLGFVGGLCSLLGGFIWLVEVCID